MKVHQLGLKALDALIEATNAIRALHVLDIEATRLYLKLSAEGTEERTAELARIDEIDAQVADGHARSDELHTAALTAQAEMDDAAYHANHCEHKGFHVLTFDELPPELQLILSRGILGNVVRGGRLSFLSGLFR